MHSITVTSSDFDKDADFSMIPDLDLDAPFEVPSVKTEVVVTNGIAATEPTALDFEICQSLENTEWHMLPRVAENAQRVLDGLNECNYPSLQDRWTLHRAMQDIREAADALERHIAKNGLWLSEDERSECESTNAPTLWIEPRKVRRTA